MENDPLIPGNDDVDDTNDISQAINPELALPTKTTSSPGADMNDDVHSAMLHENSFAVSLECSHFYCQQKMLYFVTEAEISFCTSKKF